MSTLTKGGLAGSVQTCPELGASCGRQLFRTCGLICCFFMVLSDGSEKLNFRLMDCKLCLNDAYVIHKISFTVVVKLA